jgi:hypothetical protein
MSEPSTGHLLLLYVVLIVVATGFLVASRRGGSGWLTRVWCVASTGCLT